MITCRALSVRAGRRQTLGPLDLDLGPGIHALVGTPASGGPLLLRVLAGDVFPKSGLVRVVEEDPRRPSARRAIGYVPESVALGDELTVKQALALSLTLRGCEGPLPEALLARWGLDLLAPRRVRTLSLAERRAVALAEALSSPSVRALFVHEPLCAVASPLLASLPAALRDRASTGVSIVVTTASMRDALDVADDVVFVEGGRVSRPFAAGERVVSRSPNQACLRVVASDPDALVRELQRESVRSTSIEKGGAVIVEGADEDTLARAIAIAAERCGADVRDLRPDLPSPAEVRAP